jgi:hypothetical protein
LKFILHLNIAQVGLKAWGDPAAVDLEKAILVKLAIDFASVCMRVDYWNKGYT